MPKVYIKRTIRSSLVEGTIKEMPRVTINRLSEELGDDTWYEMSLRPSDLKTNRREKAREKKRRPRKVEEVVA